MKYGARNQWSGKVVEIKKGAVMCQVTLTIEGPTTVTSVMTMDSLKELGLKKGDKARAIVKPSASSSPAKARMTNRAAQFQQAMRLPMHPDISNVTLINRITPQRPRIALALALAVAFAGCDKKSAPPQQNSSPPPSTPTAEQQPAHQNSSAKPVPSKKTSRTKSSKHKTLLDEPQSTGPELRISRSEVAGLHGFDLVSKTQQLMNSVVLTADPIPGFLRLTRGQRISMVVSELDDEVNNGGFDQYFSNSSGDFAAEIVPALHAIGAKRFEDITAPAVALFPGGTPPRDRATRNAALEKLDKAVLDKLDREFYKPCTKEELLENALERYILKHPKDFFRD